MHITVVNVMLLFDANLWDSTNLTENNKMPVHIKCSRQQRKSVICQKHIEKVIQQKHLILYCGGITSHNSKFWWHYDSISLKFMFSYEIEITAFKMYYLHRKYF